MIKKPSLFAGVILFIISATVIYNISYPFEKVGDWTSTEIVILVMAGLCFLLSIKLMNSSIRNDKKEVKKKMEKEVDITPIINNAEMIAPIPQPTVTTIHVGKEDKQDDKEEIFAELKKIIAEKKKEAETEKDDRIKEEIRRDLEPEIKEDNYFEDILEVEKKEDIISIGDKLAKDFEKSVNKMMVDLEKETDRLMTEKEKADQVHANIQNTAKKLWMVDKKLKNTRYRLSQMITQNQKMKLGLEKEDEDDE